MKGLSYRWIVAIVVIFGVFMVLLDTTIVNIAIPRLQTAFGAALTDVDWVASGYTLAEGVGIPITPYFAALLGNKRFYLIILTLFTIGSALCSLAWSLPALIAFRIIQGLAGASMLPMSITLLYTEFPPEERGIALGTLGFPLMLAPALGPSVGGYIVTFVDWRVLFSINIPIGIVGFFLAAIFLRDTRPERNGTFDFVGFIFSSAGMASLLYALSSVGANGWGSAKVLSFLIISIGSLGIFIVWEFVTIARGRQPLLDLRVFRFRSFAGGSIAMLTTVFALFGGQFMVPLYLQNLRGLSAYAAGLVLLPQALGSMVASLIGGRLVDKLGVKAVVIPGLTILSLALLGLSRLTLETPFTTFQIFLMIRGLGIGLAMQPTTVAALAEIKPDQLSQATSVNSVVRSVGSALAVAIISTVVTARINFHAVRLAEQVTPDSMMGQTVQFKAAYLANQGMSPQNALITAMGGSFRQLEQQAYLLAMNDAFLLTLSVIFVTAFVVIFVIRNPPRRAKKASQSGKPQPAVAELEHTQEALRPEPAGVAARSEHVEVAARSERAEATPRQGYVERSTSSKVGQEQTTLHDQKRTGMYDQRKDPPMRRFMRRSILIPTAIVLAILLAVGVGGYTVYNNYNFYSTDDALVTGPLVSIVPPTSGTLISLDVQVGTYVSAKQIIGTVQPISLLPVQHLVAPTDGVIVQVPGVVGQLVSPQTTVAQEVDPGSIKITAYVDESAIKSIIPGQGVDIHIDAYNSTITGHVTQIVGATAGQFSLLPTTDNSSGNYTKVSQRIPIYIQPDIPSDGSLLPGMSVEVTIHLH